MKYMKKRNGLIIFLAYFHRYGLFAVLLLMSLLMHNKHTLCAIFAYGLLIYSLWSFIGYLLRWKHIYCSYQNAYHTKMTPDTIRWQDIDKRDVYGVPLIFFVLGILMMIAAVFG